MVLKIQLCIFNKYAGPTKWMETFFLYYPHVTKMCNIQNPCLKRKLFENDNDVQSHFISFHLSITSKQMNKYIGIGLIDFTAGRKA